MNYERVPLHIIIRNSLSNELHCWWRS